mgnify:CR=1 FL=1
MAKISGLGWTTLSVDTSAGSPTDVRNDTTNFSFATPEQIDEGIKRLAAAVKKRLVASK